MRRLSLFCALFLILTPEAVGASEAAASSDTAIQPWAEGVPEAEQSLALTSFRVGNEFFIEREYREALGQYQEALSHWKHPAIYFNLVVCQVHLDKPLLAYENLGRALAFGAPALGKETYAEALTYKKLLEGRIGRLTLSIAQKGVTVSLDGELVSSSPGKVERVVLPGEHEIVAKADGFATLVQRVQVLPEESITRELHLSPLEVREAGQYETPIQRWLPWTVLGSGAAVLGAGVALQVAAGNQWDQYEEDFRAACPSGCTTGSFPSDVEDSRARAQNLDLGSFVALGVGGAAIATGVGLLIYNQPRLVDDPTQGGATVSLFPIVSPDFSGATVRGTF